MGRQRGRRTRSDEGKQTYDRLDSWELVHSPLTVEGRIEQVARFARGLRRAKASKRAVGWLMVALLLGVVPVVGWIVVELIQLLS